MCENFLILVSALLVLFTYFFPSTLVLSHLWNKLPSSRDSWKCNHISWFRLIFKGPIDALVSKNLDHKPITHFLFFLLSSFLLAWETDPHQRRCAVWQWMIALQGGFKDLKFTWSINLLQNIFESAANTAEFMLMSDLFAGQYKVHSWTIHWLHESYCPPLAGVVVISFFISQIGNELISECDWLWLDLQWLVLRQTLRANLLMVRLFPRLPFPCTDS